MPSLQVSKQLHALSMASPSYWTSCMDDIPSGFLPINATPGPHPASTLYLGAVKAADAASRVSGPTPVLRRIWESENYDGTAHVGGTPWLFAFRSKWTRSAVTTGTIHCFNIFTGVVIPIRDSEIGGPVLFGRQPPIAKLVGHNEVVIIVAVWCRAREDIDGYDFASLFPCHP